MTKQEQLSLSSRSVFDKLSWLNKQKMAKMLAGYKPSEVHCIEKIGKQTDPNVTKLAEVLYMTRGAVSKLTKKLIKRGLIDSYQKADNKKEIYFKLTEQGEKIFQTHEKLHKEFQERDQVVFEKMTDVQFEATMQFLETYNTHLENEIQKQQEFSETD